MSQNSDLNDKVRKVINDALCTQYIGNLDVIQEDDHYTLKLYLNQPDAPMYFIYQGTEEGFLKYLFKDLKTRQIDRVKYYKGVMTDTGDDDFYIVL